MTRCGDAEIAPVATLTKIDQVMDVLRAGGRIRGISRLRLVDAEGNEINAWWTAMKGARKRWSRERAAAARKAPR